MPHGPRGNVELATVDNVDKLTMWVLKMKQRQFAYTWAFDLVHCSPHVPSHTFALYKFFAVIRPTNHQWFTAWDARRPTIDEKTHLRLKRLRPNLEVFLSTSLKSSSLLFSVLRVSARCSSSIRFPSDLVFLHAALCIVVAILVKQF